VKEMYVNEGDEYKGRRCVLIKEMNMDEEDECA